MEGFWKGNGKMRNEKIRAQIWNSGTQEKNTHRNDGGGLIAPPIPDPPHVSSFLDLAVCSGLIQRCCFHATGAKVAKVGLKSST
jgi:hypothetical protein